MPKLIKYRLTCYSCAKIHNYGECAVKYKIALPGQGGRDSRWKKMQHKLGCLDNAFQERIILHAPLSQSFIIHFLSPQDPSIEVFVLKIPEYQLIPNLYVMLVLIIARAAGFSDHWVPCYYVLLRGYFFYSLSNVSLFFSNGIQKMQGES